MTKKKAEKILLNFALNFADGLPDELEGHGNRVWRPLDFTISYAMVRELREAKETFDATDDPEHR